MRLSALVAPLLPAEVRYRDDVRAALIWGVEKVEALAELGPTLKQLVQLLGANARGRR